VLRKGPDTTHCCCPSADLWYVCSWTAQCTSVCTLTQPVTTYVTNTESWRFYMQLLHWKTTGLFNNMKLAFDVFLTRLNTKCCTQPYPAENINMYTHTLYCTASLNWPLHCARSCLKKKKQISHRQLGPSRRSSSPFQHFEPARVKAN